MVFAFIFHLPLPPAAPGLVNASRTLSLRVNHNHGLFGRRTITTTLALLRKASTGRSHYQHVNSILASVVCTPRGINPQVPCPTLTFYHEHPSQIISFTTPTRMDDYADAWGSAVVNGDAPKLTELVLVWSGSKPERALSILRDCVSLMEKEIGLPEQGPPPVLSPSTHGGRQPTTL